MMFGIWGWRQRECWGSASRNRPQIGVRITQGNDEICLVSNQGAAIIFSEDDVRHMGLAAAGVLGIRLEDPASRVVMMEVAKDEGELLLVARGGLAKRTPLSEFPRQR